MSFFSQVRGLISTPNAPPPHLEKTNSKAEKTEQTEGEKVEYQPKDRQSEDMKQDDRAVDGHGKKGGTQYKPHPVAKKASGGVWQAESDDKKIQDKKIQDGKEVPQNAHSPAGADLKYGGDLQKSKETFATIPKKPDDVDYQISMLQEENKRLNERIAGMARTHPNNTSATLDLQKAERRIKELEDTNRQNLETLQAMENRYTQMQRLLEQRQVELREAKRYMKQPDEYPGSTIQKKVEGINSEIFNTVTSINDLYEASEKSNLDETTDKKPHLDVYRQVARQAIGDMLYSVNCQIDEAMLIRDAMVPEESTPLQLALCCVLIDWAVKVIGVAGSFPSDDGGLQKVYKMVRSREEKSVSSQWRVIAYGATKQLEESYVYTVLTEIMSVLCIAGLSIDSPDYQRAVEKVHRRIQNIEKLLLSLKEAIHEGITSIDMGVVSLDAGTEYDSRTMIDRYSVGTKSGAPVDNSAEYVLCTVGLGLKKITMERVAEKVFQHNTELIKPPEVVLATILKDFKLPTDQNFDEHLYVEPEDGRD